MLNRLAAFVVALLLLPPFALTVAGQAGFEPTHVDGEVWLPAMLASAAVLVFGLLLDTLTHRHSGHSLLREQRAYLLGNGVAGMVVGTLLAYLNLFAGSWFTAGSDTQSLLLATLAGIAVLPVILVTRLWLAGLPGMVRIGTRKLALPALPAELTARLLLAAALAGLVGGTVWMDQLRWLFWLSPLLLLVALQLLWDESTVFSGLARGDWSRPLLGALAGIVVGCIALESFRLGGGALYFTANTWQLGAGLSVLGLLCLQVGDIVAENWRGKPRGEVFRKKPFPVSVVTKKDQ